MLTRLNKLSSEFPRLEGFGLITRVNIHSHTSVHLANVKLHLSKTIYTYIMLLMTLFINISVLAGHYLHVILGQLRIRICVYYLVTQNFELIADKCDLSQESTAINDSNYYSMIQNQPNVKYSGKIGDKVSEHCIQLCTYVRTLHVYVKGHLTWKFNLH